MNNGLLEKYLMEYTLYSLNSKENNLLSPELVKDLLVKSFSELTEKTPKFNQDIYLNELLENKNNLINHFENTYNPSTGVNSLFANNIKEINSTDALIVSNINNELNIVVIERGYSPDKGKLSLPGGLIDKINGVNERSEDSALREAHEETNLPKNVKGHSLGTITSSLWDNRSTNPVNISGFLYEVSEKQIKTLSASDDAKSLKLIPVKELITKDMAFGHKLWIAQMYAKKLAKIEQIKQKSPEIISKIAEYKNTIKTIIISEEKTAKNNLVEQFINNNVRDQFKLNGIYKDSEVNKHRDNTKESILFKPLNAQRVQDYILEEKGDRYQKTKEKELER